MQKQDVISVLAALAHETRLDVFRILVRAGQEGVAAGALAEALDIPPASLSFHLKELKTSGVVTCRRDGRSMIYSPSFEAMASLIDFLTENCCEGEGLADCGQPTSKALREFLK